MTRSARYRLITCQKCGAEVLRAGFPKYCVPCSATASAERHKEANAKYHAANVKERNEAGRIYASKMNPLKKSAMIRAGAMLSESDSLSFETPKPEYQWQTRFWVPFTYAASKNHIYGFGHHMHKRAESREIQDAIGFAAKSSLRGLKVVQAKIWIGIIVEKPNHKGDAVNVVDLVCDALKGAIGVDDRWFSIAFVDWRINKNEPRLMIQIGQEASEDMLACSHCGRVMSLDRFANHRGSSSFQGKGRNCLECTSLSQKILRKEKTAEAVP